MVPDDEYQALIKLSTNLNRLIIFGGLSYVLLVSNCVWATPLFRTRNLCRLTIHLQDAKQALDTIWQYIVCSNRIHLVLGR